MLYISNNPDQQRQEDQASSGSGPGATNTTTTKVTKQEICCADAQSEIVVTRQDSDETRTGTRQISHDSGNASDCQSSHVPASWEQSLATRTSQQPVVARVENQETSNSAGPTTDGREHAEKRPAPSHSSRSASLDQRWPAKTKSAHQGASQKRWAASRPVCSAQSFPETPMPCCLSAQPTEASCCLAAQPQASMSGQQGRGDDDDGKDSPDDETCEPEEDEGPLDYKPILAKILNEKKLALISTPEVISFMNSGKPTSGAPPSAHRRPNM